MSNGNSDSRSVDRDIIACKKKRLPPHTMARTSTHTGEPPLHPPSSMLRRCGPEHGGSCDGFRDWTGVPGRASTLNLGGEGGWRHGPAPSSADESIHHLLAISWRSTVVSLVLAWLASTLNATAQKARACTGPACPLRCRSILGRY